MRKTAFTTVEILIVIIIVAVISGLAALSFSTIGPSRAEAEAIKITGDLCWVREMAISQNKDCWIRFASDSYEVFHTSIDPANFIKREELEVTIINPLCLASPPCLPPSPPCIPPPPACAPPPPLCSFDLVFYTFNDSPYRVGGTAYSAESTGGELVITLSEGNQSIRIFEETGYAKIE
ncbi:MAG: hypothetical protein ABIH40_05860 [Candidatus Omnitrophota bacterium]